MSDTVNKITPSHHRRSTEPFCIALTAIRLAAPFSVLLRRQNLQSPSRVGSGQGRW
jgi:hypothetical protein